MDDREDQRWAARPLQARLIRVFVFVVPIAGSILFVHLASTLVSVPTSSFWLFAAWWLGMSGSATMVLAGIDRVARRLLPLVALYRLSLVFPDNAPSRFRAALRSNTVETLEQRVARTKTLNDASTPVEAAERLLALVGELDQHDRLTRGHSERVRAYAQLIGQELHLSSDELDLLNWAALLHDVGKLNVPAEILTKPGRPTDAEWDVLRRHPEYGAELVAPLGSWLGEWARSVAEHHERWDGRGYPYGLSAEQISLAGRIVAVADVFDVITSARSYKLAFASPVARDEIAHCAGTQFDPRVVRAFLNVSLGRLRLVMGPLSWLAHAPLLGRLPLTPAIGTVAASLGSVAAALSAGVVVTPPSPALAKELSAPPHVRPAVTTPTPGTHTHLDRPAPAGHVAVTPQVEPAAVDQPATTPVSVPPGRSTPPPPATPPQEPATPAAVAGADNGAPLAADDTVTVPEGGTVLLDVLANDHDPDGDALTLVSVGRPAQGKAHAVGNRIQFVAPRDYVGRVAFAYTVADPAGAKGDGTVSVSVLLVNAPPVYAAGSDQTVLEDAGVQTIAWATEIGPGAASEAGQTVSFLVATDDTGLFATAPAIAGDGTLTYEPAPDANGTATVTVRAHDDGGTANGGTDTSAAKSFTITVKPVNDAPSFAAGADQTVDEDAGAQTVVGWARRIESGPPDESSQSVRFVTTSARPALFTAGGEPRVAPDGTLTFTTAADANGSTAVHVHAEDDGGTADGGRDTSPVQTFTITVGSVNDPPTFTAGADQITSEDAGPQTVASWATAISPGPADEAAQNVSFLVSNDNGGLFSVAPAVAPDGTLTYTSASNANGSATVTVRAKDDGGTGNGGHDTSAASTFTITVTPVNDAPVANDDAATVAEDDATGVTFDVLANDTDVDVGDALSLSSFDASTIANGNLTHNAGGSFTYVPDSAFFGTETFTYVAADTSGLTSTATVTITVTQVQHAPVAGGDAYSTAQDVPLSVAAPGVLGNDGDQDGDTITIQTAPVTAPTNGAVSLAADGSFTYTPNTGFTGNDSFAYEIDDGTGRNATGTVTITVTASPPLSSTLYLQSTGLSADIWNLTVALPPAGPRLTDFDADGKPGLTIKDSDGKETENDGHKYQTWTYTAPSPLIVNGPVTLDLWSFINGGFADLHEGTLYAYLYDCTPGGVSCTRIASNTVYYKPWGTSLLDWGERLITIGNVNHTIPTGNELRIRLQFHQGDLRMTMLAAYPSALVVTLG